MKGLKTYSARLWLMIGALLMVSLIATTDFGASFERWVFEGIYQAIQPFQIVMKSVTGLGSFAMLLVAVVVAFAARQRRLALQFLIAGGLSVFVTLFLKALIARPRPFDVFDYVSSYDALAFGYGFPSGHTAIAFCIALLMFPVLAKTYRWIPIGLASLVALSRIGLGVHAPLDIIGGLLIAGICVAVVSKVYPLTTKSQ